MIYSSTEGTFRITAGTRKQSQLIWQSQSLARLSEQYTSSKYEALQGLHTLVHLRLSASALRKAHALHCSRFLASVFEEMGERLQPSTLNRVRLKESRAIKFHDVHIQADKAVFHLLLVEKFCRTAVFFRTDPWSRAIPTISRRRHLLVECENYWKNCSDLGRVFFFISEVQ